jgi:hypothetical protein
MRRQSQRVLMNVKLVQLIPLLCMPSPNTMSDSAAGNFTRLVFRRKEMIKTAVFQAKAAVAIVVLILVAAVVAAVVRYDCSRGNVWR